MDTTTILALAGLIFGCQGLWTLINKIYENRRKDKIDNPIDKVSKQVDAIHKEVVQLSDKLDSNSEVTMSHARERLNSLCTKYERDGYIPADEYVSFKLLGESYVNAGGNHGFDVKYKWIIDSLPVKSNSDSLTGGHY